jgi:hypothetical protein
MIIDYNTILISLGGYLVIMAGVFLKSYITKKFVQNSDLGLVVPNSSGKSSLVSQIKLNLGENLSVFIIDLEEHVWSSSLISTEQKVELEKLLKENSVLFHSKIMDYSKIVYENYRANIIKTSPHFRIVILASTKDIISHIGIKSYFSLCPSSKLAKIIGDSESCIKPYFRYTMSLINMNSRSTFTYGDFQELYERVAKILNLVEKNGAALTSIRTAI